MRTTLLTIFALLGLAGAMGSPAVGAPQMLALVANDNAVSVQCQRGECFAEFTAFCLQPYRSSPIRGTVYRLHDSSLVVAMATTRDGRRIKLDTERQLRITAERSHVAVRIGMSARDMARLGLRQVRIKVARNATLVPVAVSGDSTPLDADEIAITASRLREIGADYVDREQEWMPVARLANRLINALPPGGRVSEQRRLALWSAAIRPDDFNNTPVGTAERLRAVYDDCQQAASVGGLASFRQCLESRHDRMVGTLNNRYWEVVKSGS